MSRLPNALRLAGYGTHAIRPAAVFGAFTVLLNSNRLESTGLGNVFDIHQLHEHFEDIVLADAADANPAALLLRAGKAKRLLKQCLLPEFDKDAVDDLLDSTALWDQSQVDEEGKRKK